MNITLHIREKRKEKGWSQEELADRADISTRCIQCLERDYNLPHVTSLCLIAKALGCTLDELVTIE